MIDDTRRRIDLVEAHRWVIRAPENDTDAPLGYFDAGIAGRASCSWCGTSFHFDYELAPDVDEVEVECPGCQLVDLAHAAGLPVVDVEPTVSSPVPTSSTQEEPPTCP